MKKNKPVEIDISAVRERFKYDPKTGALTRKKTTSWNARAGDIAGNAHPQGYLKVSVNKQNILCHRVAWAVHTGTQPPELIDHINGDKTDNRWENLRAATQSQNRQNSDWSKRGHRGVHWHSQKQRWWARIKVNGKTKSLGLFDDLDEATAAYAQARAHLHPGYVPMNDSVTNPPPPAP